MTDPTLTGTALIEALALHARVTTAQARTILEAAGVTVEPEKPALPTDPESVIIATEVRGVTGKWRMLLGDDGDWSSPESIGGYHWHKPHRITVWTEAVVVPAGKKIDSDDVEVGDRVRVELDGGDEVTMTVTVVGRSLLASRCGTYLKLDIHAIHLLHREGEG